MELSGIFLLTKLIAPIATLLPRCSSLPTIQELTPIETLCPIVIGFTDFPSVPIVGFWRAAKFLPLAGGFVRTIYLLCAPP